MANVDGITKHDILHLNKGRLHRLVRALIIEPVDGQILKIKISVKKFSKIFKKFLISIFRVCPSTGSIIRARTNR